jgi:hypothetical protein
MLTEYNKFTDMTPFQKKLMDTIFDYSKRIGPGKDEIHFLEDSVYLDAVTDLVKRCQEIPVNKGYTCPQGHHTEWVAYGGPMMLFPSGDMEYLPWCKPCNKYYDKEDKGIEQASKTE